MRTTLRSRDLGCPSCIAKIDKALRRLDGVVRTEVKMASGRIEVEHDPERAPAQSLVAALREIGYDARVSAL